MSPSEKRWTYRRHALPVIVARHINSAIKAVLLRERFRFYRFSRRVPLAISGRQANDGGERGENKEEETKKRDRAMEIDRERKKKKRKRTVSRHYLPCR